uniref:Uncharacterized protein n=1 Tax=Rangifer tarandus platyrhynchus TaxID=3082113 RepID=A0ACB0FH76_RANTA|nr:unnamed protein product [Rangifer tarandus platyrhynchus]
MLSAPSMQAPAHPGRVGTGGSQASRQAPTRPRTTCRTQEACLEEGPLAKLEGCWAVRRREDFPARGTEPVGEGTGPWWVGRRCREGLSSGLCGALVMGEDRAAWALFWKATPRLQLASCSPRVETRGSWARTSPSCELSVLMGRGCVGYPATAGLGTHIRAPCAPAGTPTSQPCAPGLPRLRPRKTLVSQEQTDVAPGDTRDAEQRASRHARLAPSSLLVLPSSRTHARRLSDATDACLASVPALSSRYGFCPNGGLQTQEPGSGRRRQLESLARGVWGRDAVLRPLPPATQPPARDARRCRQV